MISIAVQAHPDRREMAEALSASLPGSEIVYDPDPASALRSPWRTYRAALESTPAGATHRLIVQDDTEAVPNLVEALGRIVQTMPTQTLALFIAGGPRYAARLLYQACSRGDRYAAMPTKPWVPVVATMYPAAIIPRILAFVDEQNWKESFCSDDEIIGRALTALGEPLYATVPSLVEHYDEVESLLGPRRNFAGQMPQRVAACFLDDDIDVLSFDW